MIILMIKSFLIAWFITRFEPLQVNLNLLPNNILFNMLSMALSCSKCCSLWTTLIITHNFYYAVATSMIMIFYEKTAGRLEKKVFVN